MRMGLKATSLLNGTASLGRMFGFPCPKIPAKLIDKVKSAVSVGDGGSSIAAEFDALNASVSQASRTSAANQAQKKVRGDLLREFQELLEDHDTTHNFCGLTRKHTKEGHCVWTLYELDSD